MQPARLVLDPSTANPRSASEFLRPHENQPRGLPQAREHEADEQPQTGIVGVDEHVLG